MFGIFDSGIGGLTVVRELLRIMPDLSFIYLGDTARTPYGNKSPEVICEYAVQDTDFLLSEGAKAIIVACNTASSVAIPALTAGYPKVPIFEVVRPAVAEALRVTKTRRIGVMGTRATINSGIYERLLKEPPLRLRGGEGALRELSQAHNSSHPPLTLRGGIG